MCTREAERMWKSFFSPSETVIHPLNEKELVIRSHITTVNSFLLVNDRLQYPADVTNTRSKISASSLHLYHPSRFPLSLSTFLSRMPHKTKLNASDRVEDPSRMKCHQECPKEGIDYKGGRGEIASRATRPSSLGPSFEGQVRGPAG